MNNEYLEHHGVKGQRWGVRRFEKAASKASKDAADLRKHGYKKEADAVQKVADKNKAKAAAKQQKINNKINNKIDRNLRATVYRRRLNDQQIIDAAGKKTAKELGYKNYNHLADTVALGYMSKKDYNSFNKTMNKNYNAAVAKYVENDRHFKRAQRLINKHKDIKLSSGAKEFLDQYENIKQDKTKSTR